MTTVKTIMSMTLFDLEAGPIVIKLVLDGDQYAVLTIGRGKGCVRDRSHAIEIFAGLTDNMCD